jgi:hypothetical protein
MYNIGVGKKLTPAGRDPGMKREEYMYNAQWQDDYDVSYDNDNLNDLLSQVLRDLTLGRTNLIRVSQGRSLAYQVLDPECLAAYADTYNPDALIWAEDPGFIGSKHIDSLAIIHGKTLNNSIVEVIHA